MTSEDVARLVLEQIGDQWERWTPHGLDLRKCVLEHPTKELFVSAERGKEVGLELWRVVEEDPVQKRGYIVFYDQEEDIFGLATRDAADGRNISLGGHGDLWTALEAM